MKRKNIFWGIFLIVATILLIGSQFGAYNAISIWSILATLALVAILIQSIIYKAWFGLFLPLGFLYLIYQRPLNLIYISPWVVIIGAILISGGFHLIFKSSKKHHCSHHCSHQFAKVSSTDDDNNNPKVEVSFGDVSKYLHSNELIGGQFSCSFGNLDVYFDGVTLKDNSAEIFVKCNFGKVTLYLPKCFNVIDKVAVNMGDFNTKTVNSYQEKTANLTISGGVNMGEIKVQYI